MDCETYVVNRLTALEKDVESKNNAITVLAETNRKQAESLQETKKILSKIVSEGATAFISDYSGRVIYIGSFSVNEKDPVFNILEPLLTDEQRKGFNKK